MTSLSTKKSSKIKIILEKIPLAVRGIIGVSTILLLLLNDSIRTSSFQMMSDIYHFLKEYALEIFAAFFLIKGKFILHLFMRKMILLSTAGLGKRYLIEKVLNRQIKIHFIDHLKEDIAELLLHIKDNFAKFPLVKKIISLFAFIGSLGFVGKFMGSMLMFKVFVAKIWSFFLGMFLKVFSWVFYFISKIVWGSWLAPLLEIFFFSWFLEWMERFPQINKSLDWIKKGFRYLFGGIEKFMAKLLKKPVKRLFEWMVRSTKEMIYTFIGKEKMSIYDKIKIDRSMFLNGFKRIKDKRKVRKRERPVRLSLFEERARTKKQKINRV